MIVVMMTTTAACHLFHRDHATLLLRAAHVFELDGGVADMEMLVEQVIEPD